MKDKEKQIEEICNLLFCDKWEQPFTDCPEDIRFFECIAKKLYEHGYRKIDKDSVVLSREEYQELEDLRLNHAKDLTNAIQSYEESKADLKLEYDNHIKNLEKIIDRQSRDLNSQADRLIDLKAKLENKSKETAKKIYKLVDNKLDLYRNGVIGGSLYDSGYQTAIYDIKRTIKKFFNVEIKEGRNEITHIKTYEKLCNGKTSRD